MYVSYSDWPSAPINKLLIMCPIIRPVIIRRFSLNCGKHKVHPDCSGLCSCRDFSSSWMWTVSRAEPKQGHPPESVGSAQHKVRSFRRVLARCTALCILQGSELAVHRSEQQLFRVNTSTGISDSSVNATYHITSHRESKTMCVIQNISSRNWRDLYTLLHVYFQDWFFSGISHLVVH